MSQGTVIHQGQVWWIKLPESPKMQPVLVVQSNPFNRSALQTAVCVLLSPNWRLAEAPGNVLLAQTDTKLPRACVANVAQLITIDKQFFITYVSTIPDLVMQTVLDGIQLLLGR